MFWYCVIRYAMSLLRHRDDITQSFNFVVLRHNPIVAATRLDYVTIFYYRLLEVLGNSKYRHYALYKVYPARSMI